ncbi:cysteine desulfurase [Patescibacteria group bacterium]|nr:cysteine desulfurase [Patescibacteria group bacterium]MBU4078041.1 cysteine desulfurase [Patescibacteria group bacterium]
MKVYLDNASTTQIDPMVLEAMLPFLKKDYGNSFSPNKMGESAMEAIEKSRIIIAKSINAMPEEIIFTSGGTESNNFAIKGVAFANRDKGNHIITTKIEHKSVSKSCEWLEEQGFEITYLDVDEKGFLNVGDLEKAITDKTILVSIIHGQNEIGTIQDLNALGDICKKHNIYFHTDACQSYTKTEINVQEQAIDLISLNAHKIHGPKGVGALYLRNGTKINAWQNGGAQERGLRAGTDNVAGIVGFAKAVELDSNIEYINSLKEQLINGFFAIDKIKMNNNQYGLPHIISISFFGIEGEAIVASLDLEDIYVATGSACSSNDLQPSNSLLAIKLTPQEANSTVRFSLSRFNTEQEIDKLLDVLPKTVEKLRKISPFK